MLGELLRDLMGDALIQAVGACFRRVLGFLYLHARFWRPQRAREVLAQQYANQYALAGAAVLQVVGQFLGVILLVAFWLAILLIVARHGWS